MSSLVTGAVRSVAGKITRSGLDTRRSRPAASTIVSGAGVIREFYRGVIMMLPSDDVASIVRGEAASRRTAESETCPTPELAWTT